MKIVFHLYSTHPNCGHCMNFYHKMDQSANGPGYCGIVSAEVDTDYYCSFYRMKSKPKKTLNSVPMSGPQAPPKDNNET